MTTLLGAAPPQTSPKNPVSTPVLDEMVTQSLLLGKFDTLFVRKDGSVWGCNRRRLNEQPFFLCTDPPNNNVAIGAATSSNMTSMRVSTEGPMQISMLGAVQDATHPNATVKLYMRDGTDQRPMMNAPVHIDTIFGIGGRMYPLPEALYVDEQRALQAVFTGLGASGSVRIVAVGAKYQQLQLDPALMRVRERLQKSQFMSNPFFYSVNDGSVALTAYQTQTLEVAIDNAHNFELHQLSFVSTGSFLVNIVNLSSGESVVNAPRGSNFVVPHVLLCGTGYYPYRLHEPIMIFGGQRLLITMIDTSGAGNTVWVTLGGRAVKVRQWST